MHILYYMPYNERTTSIIIVKSIQINDGCEKNNKIILLLLLPT